MHLLYLQLEGGERERGETERGGEGGGEIGRTREVLVFFLDRT